MFGLIVSSRLVQTCPKQVSPSKFLFQIENARNIKHIVVFLLGSVPFNKGFGGEIYVSFPNSSFNYLGFISNDKPSAIFEISGLKDYKVQKEGDNSNQEVEMADETEFSVQIGISVEALEKIEGRKNNAENSLQLKKPESEKEFFSKLFSTVRFLPESTPSDYVQFIHKMMEDFFNYSVSFAKSINVNVIENGQSIQKAITVVPTSVVERWYNKIKQKCVIDPYFWR